MIHAVFFATGAAALALEVCWTRLFAAILGSSHHAIAAVVASTMGGLGVGALAGGRIAERVRRPLGLFGILSSAAGLIALAIPYALPLAVPPLAFVHSAAGGEGAPLDAARLAIAALFLLPPTILLGATLPALACAVSPEGDRVGIRVGLLYAINTLGAVAGTAAAGIWAIPSVGIRATSGIAAGLDIAAGAAALVLARARPPRPAPPAKPDPARGADPNAAAILLGMTGFAGMMLEIGWTRAFVLAVGNSTYAFTIVLAAYVLGTAAGGAIAAPLADRTSHPGRALGWIAAAFGGIAIVSLPVLGLLPLRAIQRVAADLSLGRLLGLEAEVAAALVVPAAALSGAAFPIACRLAVRGGAVGRGVGRIAGANTLGAVAGSLVAGYAILPLAGVAWAAIAVPAVVLAAAGAGMLLRAGSRGGAIAVAVAAALGVVLARPHGVLGSGSLAWHPAILASGPFLYAERWGAKDETLAALGERIVAGSRVLSYRDGPSASVAVLAERDGREVFLRISGKVDASTGGGRVSDLPTELLLGHLPILLHPAPERILTIGLGGGLTLGAILRHPVDAVDSIEISADVVDAARRYFAEANGRALEDPRVRTIIADARQHLLLADEAYDVITSEPSNPWIAGIGSLFTEEFFSLCRARLRAGGVMCQWIHATAIAPADLRLVLRTFGRVFPDAQVWLLDYDILLAGGAPVLDAARVREALAAEATRIDLGRVGIARPEDLFRHLGPRAAEAAGEGPVHRDDLPVLEFRAPFGLYGAPFEAMRDLLGSGAAPIPASAIRGAPTDRIAAIERARAQYLEERWIEALFASRDGAELRRLGEALLRAKETARAREVLARAAALDPKDARARYYFGLAAAEEGDLGLARRAFDEAARLSPENPRIRYNLGRALEGLGRREGAIEAYREAARLDPSYAPAADALRRLEAR
ncbi:MAG: fused MFS/spermidine synthase [Planctomycetes bacterium]|nr:fused MFS/spermidine synthase [Planctomycetota bacterium]